MRSISKWLVAIAATAAVAGPQGAQAGFIGMTRALGPMVKRISFSKYTLPPMAFTQFCLHYADQCKPEGIMFRGGPVRLTTDRYDDLKDVNKAVNASIVPQRNTEGLAGEKWLINPSHGDCNDYAVSKRSELLARGWPTGEFSTETMSSSVRRRRLGRPHGSGRRRRRAAHPRSWSGS